MIETLVQTGTITAYGKGWQSSTENHNKDSVHDKVDEINKAFVLKQKGEFYYEDRAVPALPSDKHVIVVIKATGLCGSDIHYWQHGEIGDFKVRKPIVLGHESAGVVQQCGPGVKSLKPGDMVAVEPGVPCRICSFCRDGRYNLCADVQFAATPPYDGTLSTYYTVPEDFCYKLPANVSIEAGALVEPLSVAVHCVKLGNITLGSTVLVMGAGPIGLLCCAVAHAFGAVDIVAVDIAEERLSFAQRYAATKTYQMEKVSSIVNAANILSLSQGSAGFDVVIDASGAEPCIDAGIRAMKRGGVFVQAGLGAPIINFPVGQICSKEGTYRGSFRYGPGDYRDAVTLLEHERVNVEELITHRYAFTEAEQAFKNVSQRQGIKSIIFGPGVALPIADGPKP